MKTRIPQFFILLFMLTPSLASAHAYLVKSVPAGRATLFISPAKIQLWFNERLEPRYSSASVLDSDGKRVDLDNKEQLVIIDLRSAKEFREKRLPGARSIPLSELEKNLRQIPKAGRVILYCDCPQSVLVQDAFQVLKDDHGYRNIAIMPEGFKGWLQRKFPVEAGAKTN